MPLFMNQNILQKSNEIDIYTPNLSSYFPETNQIKLYSRKKYLEITKYNILKLLRYFLIYVSVIFIK